MQFGEENTHNLRCGDRKNTKLSRCAELAGITAELDGAYRGVAGRLPGNRAVRIKTSGGRDWPVLAALDRVKEPTSLVVFQVDRVPAEFTHVSSRVSRAPELALSACVALIAQACNIGLEPLVHPG